MAEEPILIATRPAKKEELGQLVRIYKTVFKKHNLFDREDEDVLDYLEKKHKEDWEAGGGFLVSIVDDKIAGAALMEVVDTSREGHARMRIKHLAVLPHYQGHGAGTELVQDIITKARKIVEKTLITSVKLEAHVAAPDKDVTEFYKKQGFKVEGTLKDHYRLGEDCVVFGQLIKKKR